MIMKTLLTISIWDLAGNSRPGSEFGGRRGQGKGLGVLSRVQSLGREDPLEKEMAIHSSTIAWKIPWTEEPGRLQSMGVAKSRT